MLREKRLRKGLSQRQLSDASDVSFRMIQYYEQGAKDIRKASAETVYKLAQSLDCTMEEIIEEEH